MTQLILRAPSDGGAVVDGSYKPSEVVEVAMGVARQAISYQKVGMAHVQHTFIKVVRCNLTSRFNMVKDISRSGSFAGVILRLCARDRDGKAVFCTGDGEVQHFDLMAMVRSRGLQTFMNDLTIWSSKPSDALMFMARELLAPHKEAFDIIDHNGPLVCLYSLIYDLFAPSIPPGSRVWRSFVQNRNLMIDLID